MQWGEVKEADEAALGGDGAGPATTSDVCNLQSSENRARFQMGKTCTPRAIEFRSNVFWRVVWDTETVV